jgi:hypothetical protein
MNANGDEYGEHDDLLRVLSGALARGPWSSLAEAQAAFDATADERLSADDLAWLLKTAREANGNSRRTRSFGVLRRNGQRLHGEALERRDATAPLWLAPFGSEVSDRWTGAEMSESAFEASDWASGTTACLAVSAALLGGGVFAVWLNTNRPKSAISPSPSVVSHSFVSPLANPQITRDRSRLFDRALVELAEGSLVA